MHRKFKHVQVHPEYNTTNNYFMKTFRNILFQFENFHNRKKGNNMHNKKSFEFRCILISKMNLKRQWKKYIGFTYKYLNISEWIALQPPTFVSPFIPVGAKLVEHELKLYGLHIKHLNLLPFGIKLCSLLAHFSILLNGIWLKDNRLKTFFPVFIHKKN